MLIHIDVWIAFFALAGLVGYFADRTSICTVKAVEEMFTTRRAFMLLSFAKTVLWGTGVTIWLVWWIGAALVPGGNDVLLLNAIPGLSPHALPSYLAMLAGIAIALMVVKWRGGEWEVINCSGDQCQKLEENY